MACGFLGEDFVFASPHVPDVHLAVLAPDASEAGCHTLEVPDTPPSPSLLEPWATSHTPARSSARATPSPVGVTVALQTDAQPGPSVVAAATQTRVPVGEVGVQTQPTGLPGVATQTLGPNLVTGSSQTDLPAGKTAETQTAVPHCLSAGVQTDVLARKTCGSQTVPPVLRNRRVQTRPPPPGAEVGVQTESLDTSDVGAQDGNALVSRTPQVPGAYRGGLGECENLALVETGVSLAAEETAGSARQCGVASPRPGTSSGASSVTRCGGWRCRLECSRRRGRRRRCWTGGSW